MGPKESFSGSKYDDTTGQLVFVSYEEALSSMFDRLFFDGEGSVNGNEVVVSLHRDDLKNTTDIMQEHLGLKGLFGGVEKAEISLIRDGDVVRVRLEKKDKRVVFAYDMDSMDYVGSMQRRIGRSNDTDKWEQLGTVNAALEDLHAIAASVELALVKRSGSL